jgi:hypothetical protein
MDADRNGSLARHAEAAEAMDDVLRRALDYPYQTPPHSYLYDASVEGHWRPLTLDPKQLNGRTPVLASGSNRAPERLAQKFKMLFPSARIPVTRARLLDFDSVYCAHVTSYGSIPATLHPSPGTATVLHVTWLTDGELACMHETEQPGVNYHFVRMKGIDLAIDGGLRLDRAYAYLSVHGAALEDGAPVALAAIEASHRRFACRHQGAMLKSLAAKVAPGVPVFDFIRTLVGAEEAPVKLRTAHEALMRTAIERFPFETVEIVPV